MYLPPEWHPHAFTQLTWPHAQSDWSEYLDEIDRTYVQMALAITNHEPLLIVTPEPQRVEALLRGALPEANMQKIRCHKCPTNDTWARDHGFITLIEPHTFLDFRFNGWGEKFEAAKDNAINLSLSESGVVGACREDHLDFVLEGGAIESDGRGTILTTSCCLLAPHRNQPLSREEIEQQLMKRLRAERVLWLDHGSLIGDDTDGHVDTLARLAPDDTILYCRPEADDPDQYDDLLQMEQDLQALRTASGRPYRLLALPTPDPICFDGERLPATYANFYVLNGAVLCPDRKSVV